MPPWHSNLLVWNEYESTTWSVTSNSVEELQDTSVLNN